MKMPKGVRILEIDSIEKVQDIWNRLNNIKGLFDDFQKDREAIFVNMLRSPDTVWLERTDGNGILYLTNVIKGLSATGHVVYWDKRLRGREEFTLDCLRWLMSVIPLLKVNLYLPGYATAARAFAERIGFRREGCIRRWSFGDGKLFDIFVYGMTYEEAFDGRVHDTRSPGVSRSTPPAGDGLVQPEGTDASAASSSTEHATAPTSGETSSDVSEGHGSRHAEVLPRDDGSRGDAGHNEHAVADAGAR